MSEFILPRRWHVIVTQENAKDTFKWRMNETWSETKNHRVSYWKENINKIIVGICDGERKGHNPLTADNTDFGIEITNEQFKEYVLGKKPKKQKSIKEDTSYLINFLKQNNIT